MGKYLDIAKKAAESRKNDGFLEQQAILEWAREMSAGGHPVVFYLPGRSSNVYAVAHEVYLVGCPEGTECDVEAWDKSGRRGAAPLKPISAALETAQELEAEVDLELGGGTFAVLDPVVIAPDPIASDAITDAIEPLLWKPKKG